MSTPNVMTETDCFDWLTDFDCLALAWDGSDEEYDGAWVVIEREDDSVVAKGEGPFDAIRAAAEVMAKKYAAAE